MKTPVEVTIALDYPVQLADRLLAEVRMRRPTMKEQVDYKLDGKQSMETEMRLYARLCGLQYEDILLFDVEDYEKLPEQFLIFRQKPQSEGNPSLDPDAE